MELCWYIRGNTGGSPLEHCRTLARLGSFSHLFSSNLLIVYIAAAVKIGSEIAEFAYMAAVPENPNWTYDGVAAFTETEASLKAALEEIEPVLAERKQSELTAAYHAAMKAEEQAAQDKADKKVGAVCLSGTLGGPSPTIATTLVPLSASTHAPKNPHKMVYTWPEFNDMGWGAFIPPAPAQAEKAAKKSLKKSGSSAALMYGSFDSIVDHFSRIQL